MGMMVIAVPRNYKGRCAPRRGEKRKKDTWVQLFETSSGEMNKVTPPFPTMLELAQYLASGKCRYLTIKPEQVEEYAKGLKVF